MVRNKKRGKLTCWLINLSTNSAMALVYEFINLLATKRINGELQWVDASSQ